MLELEVGNNYFDGAGNEFYILAYNSFTLSKRKFVGVNVDSGAIRLFDINGQCSVFAKGCPLALKARVTKPRLARSSKECAFCKRSLITAKERANDQCNLCLKQEAARQELVDK